MIAFKEATYRAQVSRLRKLAIKALESYKLKILKISFIQHGENATYKITAKSGDLFLLRIHRADYHTQAAIQEELLWLDQLATVNNLNVPKPIKSKNNKFFEAVFIQEIGEPRFCCMFKWVNGRFIDKHLTPQQSYNLGQFTANLHTFSKNITAKNRRYWTANG